MRAGGWSAGGEMTGTEVPAPHRTDLGPELQFRRSQSAELKFGPTRNMGRRTDVEPELQFRRAGFYCDVPRPVPAVVGFPSASSTTMSPSFSSRMPGSIFVRSPTSSNVDPSGLAYFFAAASACSKVAVFVASY